jgi:hypothetical protein
MKRSAIYPMLFCFLLSIVLSACSAGHSASETGATPSGSAAVEGTVTWQGKNRTDLC